MLTFYAQLELDGGADHSIWFALKHGYHPHSHRRTLPNLSARC